jgi:hypothetical protein
VFSGAGESACSCSCSCSFACAASERAACISAPDRRFFRALPLISGADRMASRCRCCAAILAVGERICRHFCLTCSYLECADSKPSSLKRCEHT